MAENTQPQLPVPDLHNMTPEQVGGVLNPINMKPVSLDLPEPPRNYPLGVQASNLIPTQKSITGSEGIANNLHNMAGDVANWATNPYHYAKTVTYNADYDGANFKRYAAVPRLMREYGFTPYRDNESLYNEHASNWEYFSRSVGQGFELFKTGFSSMLPWNAWDGEEVDLQAAREMERAHAIGADTRSGFGSWVNNMTVDSGYTFGILGEFAAEELVGWVGSTLLAPETAGGSWAVMGAETVSAVNKMRKLFNLADRAKDLAKGIGRTYDWVRSADKMKDIYNYAKTGTKWVGKQLLPESFKWGSEMMKSGFTMRGGQLVMDAAKASKGFGAFYRDMRAYAAVVSEAKLEGGSAELQVRDKLIDEYVASHNGEMPDQATMNRIYTEAANAGHSTFWWNVPALYISNKIVFDKALKGFKPIAAFREELEIGIKGRLAFNEAWKQAGVKAWTVVDDGFKATLKNLTKASTYAPKNLLKNGLNTFVKYGKANLTEGLQEVYQDVVQKTMTEYYEDRFHHPGVEGSRSIAGSFLENLGPTTFSEQGWDTFASGFFMGGMVQMPQRVAFEWIPKQFWKIKDRAGYEKHMSDMENHTNSVVNALNAATMDDKFWDSITENTVQQLNNSNQAHAANAAGDKKAYYDIVDEDVFNHMHTLLKSGKLSLIKDHIKDLKGLDEKSLQEAFGPVEESEGNAYDAYQKRLDSMMNKMSLVEKHYQAIEKRFSNPFDPNRYNRKKDPDAYNAEMKAYEAFEQAKKAAVYSNYAFERSVERMHGVMSELVKNKPVGEAAASDFTTILNKDNLDAEVEILENEIQTYRKGDSDAQSKANKLQKKLDLLKDYQDAVETYQEALKIHSKDKAQVSGEEVAGAKRAAKVTVNTKVKNKKGKEAVVAKIKKGVAYDKAGNRIGKLNSLEIISGERDSEMMDAATEDLYEKYHAYLKHIASDKGTFAPDEHIQNSFQKVKDYYSLAQDALDMADAVDTLHNPSKFSQYASRISGIYEEAKKQNKDRIQKSYERFLRMRKVNDLFNQLYNMGVFLDEDGIKAVLDRKIPSDFYSIPKKERISEDDPKYKEILDLFEKFEETEKTPFGEKPIPEEEFDPERFKYASGGRNKIKGDNRNYKEHAEYWGFDPDPNKVSKVNTREILQKIIDSPFATRREKMLARRLKAIVSKDSVTTFGKQTKPGFFTYSTEGKIGTFIDARFTASDYRGGGMPMEMLLIHELIHEITSLEMDKDAEFKAAISKLLAAAKEAYKKNPPSDQTLYPGADKKPFYGLMNEHEFLAEMFSNDRFALWLDTIPYESTGQSLWKEFVDQLEKFLKRLLGVREGSTLLNEAIYIATSHIDRIHGLVEPVKETTTPTAKVEGGKKTLTLASSVEDFRNAGLLDAIIKEYRKFVTLQNEASAEGWIDSFALEKNDEQIAASDAFRQYLQMGPGAVNRILQEYNRTAPKTEGIPLGTAASTQLVAKGQRLGFTKEQLNAMTPEERDLIRQANTKEDVQTLLDKYAEVTPQPQAEVRELADRTQKRVLVEELGFSWTEANQMTKADAEKLISEGLTKEQRLEAESAVAEQEARFAEAQKEFLMEFMEQRIANAHYLAELKAIEDEIAEALAVDPLNIDTDRMNDAIEKRKQELAREINFEDIKENEVVIMRDNRRMVVVEKTGNALKLRKFGETAGNIENVYANEVQSKILYKDQPFMEKVDINPPVTPEVQNTSNENVKMAQDLNTTEAIEEDRNAAKTMTEQEVNDEFDNSIGCE